jgi:hypothetical protein
MVCCTYFGGSNVTASNYARMAIAGAVIAGSALGFAANAAADDNCDPFMLSMTPQPVLSCQAPDVAPPPAEVPPPAEPGPFGFAAPAAPPLLDGSAG